MAPEFTNRFRNSARPVTLRWVWLLLAFVVVAGLAFDASLGAQAPLIRRSEDIPGLVSKARLNPPLRSRLRELRFSPNGGYVLLQDETVTYVIATNPLGIVFQLGTNQFLPLRFSADSQTIVAATPDMRVERYDVLSGKQIDSRTLGSGDRCHASMLSLDGELYACLDGKSELRVFRTRTGVQVFDGRMGDQPGQTFSLPVPYHMGLARSEPFGYYLANVFIPPDFMRTTPLLKFSPDGHYLLAHGLYPQAAALIDVQRGAQTSVPKGMRRGAEEAAVEFVAPDKVLVTDPTKKEGPILLSFPAGEAITKLAVGGEVAGTSNPRYAIAFPQAAEKGKDANVVDLQTGKSVAITSKLGADVWGSQIVSYTDAGALAFTRIGDENPFVRAGGMVSPLATLQVAAVSPGLEKIAVGLLGQGGVFDVSSGERAATFDALSGAWFANDRTCYVRIPAAQPDVSTIESVDAGSGAVSDITSIEDIRIRNESISSGPVVLSHFMMRLMVLIDLQEIPFELHGLDATTGKMLWLRAFGGDPTRINTHENTPVPFTDPQGDRVVLGWPAKTSAGKEAANRDATTKHLMKQAKLSEHDSLFEVLDAQSGKTIGAALVQTGAGPATFDSAFSEGDWLVLVKDGRRVIVVSLSTGEQIAEEAGYGPAVAAETGLLSFVTNGAKLALYDLKTRARKYEYSFPQEIAYSHFSADGKRLLVMTEDQTVYVLDAASVPTPPAAQP
jgi:WD40 repeat protein